MSIRIRIFSDQTEIEEAEYDTVRNPIDLLVDPEKELLFLVELHIGWKVDLSRGTIHERSVWGRADTLARFRRALMLGAAIIFRGRPRPMDQKRAERYERAIRAFDRPPFVIADDPGIALCLDIGFPSGA